MDLIALGEGFTDLTVDAWKLFQRRAKIPADMEPLTALANLHLFKDGSIAHAGAWLLAKDIRKFSISADVACALFLGTDKERILDRRGFESDIYSMIDDVVVYILSKINVEYIIKHVKREERPELPEEALRETVVNALAHRDYRSTANVQVYIFKDRVEIVSPGRLPAGMTKADLGFKSIPRNPLLFGMLHRMEAVEHIGSGIRRIRNLCRDYGVAVPQIDVSEHWFTVIFPRPGSRVENQQPEFPPHDKIQEAHDEAHDDLTDIERKILEMCIVGQRTGSELRVAAGYLSRSGNFKRSLEKLLVKGLIEMTIPDKPRSKKQRYQLTERGVGLHQSKQERP